MHTIAVLGIIWTYFVGVNNDTEQKQFTLDVSHGKTTITPREEPDKKKKQTQNDVLFYYIGSAGQIGFAITIPLLFGIFVGVFLDNKFGTKPMYTLGGFAVGIVLSVFSLVHTVRDIIKKK